MACGTPVIGFDAGGIPEYVRHERTGLLATLGNEEQLAEQIDRLVQNRNARLEMGRQARKMMETDFEAGQQTAEYVQLYNRATGKQQAKAA
jgi:glycosyltransferase involved in cell wall biosynthesis